MNKIAPGKRALPYHGLSPDFVLLPRNHPLFTGFLCYNSVMRRSLIFATMALGLLWSTAETTAQAQMQSRPGVSRNPGGQSGRLQTTPSIASTPQVFTGGGQHHRGGGVQIGIGAGIGFGNGRANFRGRLGHYSNRCLRGGCGFGGAYYSPYYSPYYAVPVYVGPVSVHPDPGPDFYAPNSSYTIEYGPGRVPKEYVAPGADAVSAAYRQGQLEQRITSLADEVARLRAEKEERERAVARQRDPRSIGESFADAGVLDANTPAAGPNAAATATLVFRSGRRLDIANYAVVGRTLWVFDEQRARRVPLAELNLDATRKANAASGFDLKLPAQK